MMSRHDSLRGGLGGHRLASSTAVVNDSIVTCAMSGVPNLLCTISPCSVTRSPPCAPRRIAE